MILELDTTLLDIFGEISINQLVFLTLVLNDNQSNNQDVHKFLSRISENDIQELIDNDLISFTTSGDNKIYSPTEKLLSSTKQDKTWFDEFYEVFPVYVLRPDGTKGFLRSNINKCRKEYNRIVLDAEGVFLTFDLSRSIMKVITPAPSTETAETVKETIVEEDSAIESADEK